jgi:hypothetical protein
MDSSLFGLKKRWAWAKFGGEERNMGLARNFFSVATE